MKDTITQRVYKEDMLTFRRWMNKLGLKTFAELTCKWKEVVDLKVHEKWYAELTSKTNFVPQLSGCKIDKKKLCIQKRG